LILAGAGGRGRPAAWAAVERSARDFGLDGFPRLAHSGEEARRILRLAAPGERLAALGFDATRELMLSGELARYRTGHIASHALDNPVHPELSGVVMSLVDRRGEPLDPFVRFGDLARLRLPAELVVLSACRTGRGAEVRGEGVVGLAWGLFAAGAARGVVSYWNVSDPSTAELMARFYRGRRVDGLTAAAALRRAQLDLAADPRWSAPYHWAAFTLQGDWR
jgi:CHAT domain-containing protein